MQPRLITRRRTCIYDIEHGRRSGHVDARSLHLDERIVRAADVTSRGFDVGRTARHQAIAECQQKVGIEREQSANERGQSKQIVPTAEINNGIELGVVAVQPTVAAPSTAAAGAGGTANHSESASGREDQNSGA